MRLKFLIILLLILFTHCQSNKITPKKTGSDSLIQVPVKDTPVPDTVSKKNIVKSKQKLALTALALQLVDSVTGKTRQVNFGMPYSQLVTLIGGVLESAPASVGVNTECGAGHLKMASWSNGLTLVFQEKKKGDDEWLFAGWFVGKPKDNVEGPATMASIGVGSTLEELESAYVATVTKTTLGKEFSVKSGFYGLLSGTGKQAVIEAMWSGVSCNFR